MSIIEDNSAPSAAVLNNKPYNNYTVTGIVLSILFPAALVFCSSSALLKIFHTTATNGQVIYFQRLLVWICLGIIWLYAMKMEKESFLPWQERNYGVLHAFISVLSVMGIIFIGCIIINIILFLTHQNLVSEKIRLITAIFKKDKFLLVFTALTAGVVEELIFRGYLQPRLQQVFNRPWIAIAISSVIFGALHFTYGTIGNVLGPMFIGFVFACYYYQYRNLKVLIIAHFLWDLIVLLLQIKK